MYAIGVKEVSYKTQDDYLFHLPDREFFDLCANKYSINRGVFNVIDSWFFDYGMKDIITRRQVINQFLSYLASCGFYNEKKLFLQFGKGGVKESLNCFSKRYLTNDNRKGDFIDSSSK